MILEKRLTKDGHSVVIAEHGGDALRLLEVDPHFDLVLMDLQMPVRPSPLLPTRKPKPRSQILNGFEAATGIRSLEAASCVPLCDQRPSTILNGRLPILAVSASLHERAKHTIEEVGIDGWILKPVDFRRLASLMRGAIDREKRRDDVYRCVLSSSAGGPGLIGVHFAGLVAGRREDGSRRVLRGMDRERRSGGVRRVRTSYGLYRVFKGCIRSICRRNHKTRRLHLTSQRVPSSRNQLAQTSRGPVSLRPRPLPHHPHNSHPMAEKEVRKRKWDEPAEGGVVKVAKLDGAEEEAKPAVESKDALEAAGEFAWYAEQGAGIGGAQGSAGGARAQGRRESREAGWCCAGVTSAATPAVPQAVKVPPCGVSKAPSWSWLAPAALPAVFAPTSPSCRTRADASPPTAEIAARIGAQYALKVANDGPYITDARELNDPE